MRYALSKNQVDSNEIESLNKQGRLMFDSGRQDYLMSVCFPKLYKCRIPRIIQSPSFLTQVHLVTYLTTNANGALAFTYNPFFFAQQDNTNAYSTFFLNTDTSLNGTATSNFFTGTNISQNGAPAGTFGSYCLSSGTMEVSYIGTLDQTKGIIGGGIAVNTQAPYAHPPVTTAAATVDADSVIFSNFLNVDNLPFAYRTQLINGLKMNYFPVDDHFLNFRQIILGNPTIAANDETSSPWGFAWVCYIANGPPSTIVARLDVYLNLELMVQPQMRNFINNDVQYAKSRTTLQETSEFVLRNPGFISGEMSGNDNDRVSTFEGFKKLLGGNTEDIALIANKII